MVVNIPLGRFTPLSDTFLNRSGRWQGPLDPIPVSGVADIAQLSAARVADLGRRPPVDLRKESIEPPNAAKAGPHGDLRNQEIGLVEQSFGPLHAGRLCDLHRARTKVLVKKPAEMPCSDPQSIGQDFDPAVIEGTVIYQTQCAFDCGPRSLPRGREWCSLRPAPQARAKSRSLG